MNLWNDRNKLNALVEQMRFQRVELEFLGEYFHVTRTFKDA